MVEIIGSQSSETLNGSPDDDVITAFAPGAAASSVVATRILADLAKPIAVAAPPDDSARLFIVERDGLLKVMDLASGTVADTPVLDLTGQVATDGERGLLGLTFHPDFAANGRFFVFLSQTDGTSEIREYRFENTGVVEPENARTIIEVPQPDFATHKGGWLGFGPDGMLYATVGDGGGVGDPFGNAQNLETLLGSVIRLDVDGDDFADDPQRNYAIPEDNPFAATAGRDEIFAYGLRNPFRAGFDPATGRLFVADVGQDEREEVNIVGSGANLGWPLYEGNAPYADPVAPPDGLTFPIHDYTQASGDGRSVTGGTVYRGPSEALHGAYVFGDFISGRIFALDDTDGDGTWTRSELTGLVAPSAGAVDLPVAFAAAPDGALLVVDYGGEVFRLDPMLSGPADAADLILAGDGRDIVHAGGGGDTVEGGAGDDTVNGLDGNDVLDGGEGNDRLVGGAGNDTFLVDSRGDVVIETATGGADTVIASSADGYVLPSGVEVLVLAGSGALGVGNAADNMLLGSDGANLLYGQGGEDFIRGGAGDDVMWGGPGGDVFVFAPGDGNDVVADFDWLTDDLDFGGRGAVVGTEEADGFLYIFDTGDTVLLYGAGPPPAGSEAALALTGDVGL